MLEPEVVQKVLGHQVGRHDALFDRDTVGRVRRVRLQVRSWRQCGARARMVELANKRKVGVQYEVPSPGFEPGLKRF
jgi:hypothetical protein